MDKGEDELLDARAARDVRPARSGEQDPALLTERAATVAVESARVEMGRVQQERDRDKNTILTSVVMLKLLSNSFRRKYIGRVGKD